MSTKITFQKFKERSLTAKRGDTIIEVMFAIAVFSLVAVITISMMNLGTANAEGSLELTTARHELNAQAEALRFVHSAYTAELALPTCSAPILQKGEKCQQYKELWEGIIGHARSSMPDDRAQQDIIDITNTLNNSDPSAGDFHGAIGCQRAYEPGVFSGDSLLTANKAFVLNIRDLSVAPRADNSGLENPTRAIISASNGSDNKFVSAPLSARIIYARDGHPNETTEDGYAARNMYNQVSQVEGIWVIAIAGDASGAAVPPFYDFYIQTCWNAPNSLAPTILDTVIRLYNPGAK